MRKGFIVGTMDDGCGGGGGVEVEVDDEEESGGGWRWVGVARVRCAPRVGQPV